VSSFFFHFFLHFYIKFEFSFVEGALYQERVKSFAENWPYLDPTTHSCTPEAVSYFIKDFLLLKHFLKNVVGDSWIYVARW
jgi:hypothetical protein